MVWVMKHNKVLTFPNEKPTVCVDLFFSDSAHLLPSCVSPGSSADDSATVFLACAVPQKHQPSGPLVWVAAHKIRAVEGAGMYVYPVHITAKKNQKNPMNCRNPTDGKR
jgi:hypothetical protein